MSHISPKAIKVFKSPSKIKFTLAKNAHASPVLGDAKRGDTFLLNDSVHMRVDVSLYQVIKDFVNSAHIQDVTRNAVYVLNLQTGRAYVSDPANPVEWVKVAMTLEGE